MKKLILGLLSLVLIASTVQAQDAGAAYKEAKKAMRDYPVETDGDKKASLLAKAVTAIGKATASASSFEGKDKTKMLMLAGQIFNEQANMDLKQQVVNADFKSAHPDAALKSFKAFTQVLEIADKKYFKNDAMAGLKTTADHLANAGLFAFKGGEYAKAYEAYNSVLTVKNMLDGAGKKGVLAEDGQLDDHMYMVGLSALQADMKPEATKVFSDLSAKGYEDSGVYNALYKLNADENPEKAEEFLSKGREKFPEDQGLMVTELNHYLKSNRFDELVVKLEKAIAADPENVSYYSALGNTYDNLFQKEMAAKNMEAANGHFEKALSYYGQALEKDGEYFFAIYNSGVLYVNKANLIIEELKVLEDKGDYSKAALRSMEVKKSAISTEFDKALPFFQKAESLNANDVNTLNALKEIYARKEDFKTSKEFGRRMKVVQDGGENEKSHFDQ